MRLLVIQHIACEPPGAYEDEMLARGIAFERVQIDEGQPLPDWRSYQGIVAMGGPMSANDDELLPWLAGEKRAIAEAVRAGMPYWGVCLGAQLLASALGARVYRGDEPELGIYEDLAPTPQAGSDPVFMGLASPLSTFQWHGETFDLPTGATRLASSPAYPNQAFVWQRAYGLQFHMEVFASLAASWLEIDSYAEELRNAQGAAAPGALADRLPELDSIVPLAREMFGRFLAAIPGRSSPPQTARPAD